MVAASALLERTQKLINQLGRGISWLSLLMVVLIFAIVLMRYVFNAGSIALQESATYLHVAVFMLAAAWVLAEDGHVRVDIFYRDASPRYKAWVNLLGSLLLLLPFTIFIFVVSWDYVASSIALHEGSREAGGLPLVWLLKGIIPVFAVLLSVQAVLLAANSWQKLFRQARA